MSLPHAPMTAPSTTRAMAMARLMDGVRADLASYEELQRLLEAQFDAALQHRSAQLAELADRITALVDALDHQRRERMALVARVLGADEPPTMAGVLALLNPAARQTLAGWWRTLEARVRESKALNARNARLMADQRDIMQRVMGRGQEHEMGTYGPA